LAIMARAGARGSAWWLRCDLRLDDNLALKAATEGAQSFLPIYVFDPEKFNTPTLAGARKSSARRARFLVESVQCLRHKLEQRGSGLAVALGPPQEVIPKLAESCASVTVTKGFCSEEQQEEHLVSKRLKAGAELRSVWGGTLYMPEECGQNPASTPLLFTSFKNKAEGRGHIRAPVSAPKQLPPVPNLGELKEALSFLPTLQQLGYENEEVEEALRDDPRGVLPFQGGEDAALARLQKWMFDDNHLKDYFDIRNGMLGEGFSSKLSPWLALGCISPRRIWAEAKRYETERRIQNKSTYWLVFELTWRDFFIYMAWSQGDKIFLHGGITGDRTAWRGSKDKLQRWKEGTTGDQLVDANMRELKATGFMSNRGRQNVASFLIFDLGVDWRHGAAHFEELLLDYDPCSNWGNWVAAAGLTGQRINKFNTRKQLQDYDPHREYVNHWLRGDGRKVQTQTVLTFQPAREEGTNNGPEGKRGRWGRDKGKGKGYSSGQKRHRHSRWIRLVTDPLTEVLTALAQAKEEDLLQECIQAFTDVATVEPDFFKAQLAQNLEPAKFMATVARTREACESGLRGLAIEWLVSYVEKRHKFLSKSAPDFINLTLECCMSLMLEVDDSEEKLKEWIERMDDEEGEEDEDELFHTGEECIDRVAEAAGMDVIGQGLFRLIGHFSSQESWQAKHAALAAVKQTVEYVEEQAHVDEMARLLLNHVDHPHPRVRFTALHGLGQLANDQSPHFQETSHQQVMPVLTRKMDDQMDRVAAMAMSAFVSFGEELDNSLMAGCRTGRDETSGLEKTEGGEAKTTSENARPMLDTTLDIPHLVDTFFERDWNSVQ
ncbi:Cryptochrome DASH, partial [Durusdinium trenchii]